MPQLSLKQPYMLLHAVSCDTVLRSCFDTHYRGRRTRTDSQTDRQRARTVTT